MSLCPCSKEISDRGAHNQRSVVRMRIKTGNRLVWIEELVAIAEAAASSPLYSLLKREDEKAVTEAAYDNPRFVEDIVRTVANALEDDPRVTAYRVECENFESIHNHSAYAAISKGL
jgi:GTP cyclohydrolase I